MKHDATKDITLGLITGMKSDRSGNLVSEEMGAAEAVQMQEIPVEGTQGNEADWESLGFKLGPPSESDPLFRPVLKAPPGWNMGRDPNDCRQLILTDPQGRTRGYGFYKNAYYDRYASFYLTRRLSIGYVPSQQPGIRSTNAVLDALQSDANHATALYVFDEPMREDERLYEYNERSHAACVEWLQNHYPSRSPADYWDDELEPGQRIERRG